MARATRESEMSSNCKPLSDVTPVSELEKLALERVLKAGVKAPASAIFGYIRSVGPASIMLAKLRDIRAVANAF